MSPKMPTNIRLTTTEQEALRKKATEINKELIKKGLQPLRDSELVHSFLLDAIKKIELSASGKIILPD